MINISDLVKVYKSKKKNQVKALGMQNKAIGTVFGLQICLIALLTIIMSTLGYFLFIDLADDVLIESLRQLEPSHIVLDLDFLTFKLPVVGMNVLLIVVLCILSLFVPLIKIKNIKPVQIIKAKESPLTARKHLLFLIKKIKHQTNSMYHFCLFIIHII